MYASEICSEKVGRGYLKIYNGRSCLVTNCVHLGNDFLETYAIFAIGFVPFALFIAENYPGHPSI